MHRIASQPVAWHSSLSPSGSRTCWWTGSAFGRFVAAMKRSTSNRGLSARNTSTRLATTSAIVDWATASVKPHAATWFLDSTIASAIAS